MDKVIAAEDIYSKTSRRNTECEQVPCYSDKEIFQNSKFIHNTNKCTFMYNFISLPLHGTHIMHGQGTCRIEDKVDVRLQRKKL